MLVKLFALDFPEYKVRTNKNVVYRRGFMFASLDAELTDGQGQGFLECKTTEIHSQDNARKWNRHITRIPLHSITSLLRSNWLDFAFCKAQLRQTGLNEMPGNNIKTLSVFRGDLKKVRYLPKEKSFGATSNRKNVRRCSCQTSAKTKLFWRTNKCQMN